MVGDYGTQVDDPVLQFWSPAGVLLKSLGLQGDAEVRNISWKRDGSRLATAIRRLMIWSKDGDMQFKADGPDLLRGVAWHPDNDTILTSDLVGRITLWNANTEPINQIHLPESAKDG